MNANDVLRFPKDVPTRIIAVVHRVKKTVNGDARPTLVRIRSGGEIKDFVLETEREEFDFIFSKGKFVEVGIAHGDVVITTLGGSGDRMSYSMSRRLESLHGVMWRVPAFRMREFKDKQEYHNLSDVEKTDPAVLHCLWAQAPEEFFECRIRDRETILISELYQTFKEAQLERMKCAGRLRARMIGQLFLSNEGGYPEGKIEDLFDALKSTDPIYRSLEEEEKRAKVNLEYAINATRIGDMFAGVMGCGPSIIGGLVRTIGDIRRFASGPNLVSYVGLAVLKQNGEKARKGERIDKGLFPRQRRGMRTSWNRTGRQTLYTLSDQFNRRPESKWGKCLIANKLYYRNKHPDVLFVVRNADKDGVVSEQQFTLHTKVEVIEGKSGPVERKSYWYNDSVSGKEVKISGGMLTYSDENGREVKLRGTFRYFDGHIHKMAIWKTLREFVLWLHTEWTKFEKAEYVPKEPSRRGRKTLNVQ